MVKLIRQSSAIIVLLLLLPSASKAARPDVDREPIAAVVAEVTSAVVRTVSIRSSTTPVDKPEARVLSTADFSKTTASIGSGFIIDPSGFIATNKHVIEGAVAVFVVTADGVRYTATVAGSTAKADMALLKIDAGRPLPAVRFGDSDKVHVGDTVIAIGSPFGFDNSVTAGIISAVNRDIMESPFDDYFQTDAATNHGNSGGPLLNLAGEVIGMNSVIFSPVSGWVGLSFAVPSNGMRFVFDRLMKTGHITAGMLPIHTQQVSWMLEQAFDAPSLDGALVSAVIKGDDPALEQKIRIGDIVLSINGQKVLDPRDLARKAAQAPIGSDAVLEIYRGGLTSTVHVTVQAWPQDETSVVQNNPQQKLGLDFALAKRDSGLPVTKVVSVDPNGSAADSGIQIGDIVIAVQQTPVTEPDEVLSLLSARALRQHPFAAGLVERGNKQTWIPISLPK